MRVVLAVLLVVGLSGSPAGRSPVPAASATGAYRAPLRGPLQVVNPFVAPATPYGPGHRGVDLATGLGQPVLAPADGVVVFAGTVAGRGVVVLRHDDGIRTEYEPVSPRGVTGRPVHRGDVIGVIEGRHDPCPSGPCLHWGARRGQTYLDPLTLLRPLGRVRLVPLTTATP